jgi:threonine/homoserine/homoserine lactone efflux protein
MITWPQLSLFSAASLVLIFTPGPDILYVMTRGVAQGRSAAFAAAAGFSIGNIVHTLAAVVGLSAILASSATAFGMVKLAGGLYLIYLGIQLFRAGEATFKKDSDHSFKRLGTIFRQSIIANILNPKVAIFFLAFFPQFVRSENGSPQLQMLLLGLTFIVLTFIGFNLVGWFAGSLGDWLKRRPNTGKWIHRLAGSMLVGLGLKLAWPEAMPPSS